MRKNEKSGNVKLMVWERWTANSWQNAFCVNLAVCWLAGISAINRTPSPVSMTCVPEIICVLILKEQQCIGHLRWMAWNVTLTGCSFRLMGRASECCRRWPSSEWCGSYCTHLNWLNCFTSLHTHYCYYYLVSRVSLFIFIVLILFYPVLCCDWLLSNTQINRIIIVKFVKRSPSPFVETSGQWLCSQWFSKNSVLSQMNPFYTHKLQKFRTHI